MRAARSTGRAFRQADAAALATTASIHPALP